MSVLILCIIIITISATRYNKDIKYVEKDDYCDEDIYWGDHCFECKYCSSKGCSKHDCIKLTDTACVDFKKWNSK